MKKDELVRLGLDDATAEKVAAASSEELKGYVPKSRFDEVNEAKTTLTADIKKRDEQLEALKKTAGDAEALNKTIAELQAANAQTKTEYEVRVKQMQIDAIVERELTGVGAKNLKAARALLDLSAAEIDGETIKGLGDQLKKLQGADDTKFLFNPTPTPPKMTGMKPGETSKGPEGADELQAGYDAAIKNGDTATAVMYKNQMFERQKAQ